MKKEDVERKLVARNLQLDELTYRKAFYLVLRNAGIFSLSRLPVAINIVANGAILSHLSDAEISSGPLITTLVYAVMGTGRNILLSTGMAVGKLFAAEREGEIGDLIKQSWRLGLKLSVIASAILLTINYSLKGIGISSDVADATQDYFYGLSYGIPPTFWLASDQQFALGIKRNKIPLIAGIAYAALTMLIGFPLSLGAFSLPKLGTQGLGHGAALSAWITLLGLRLYYKFDSTFQKYNLFKWGFGASFDELNEALFERAPALGFQNMSEWGNLLGISLMLGKVGDDALQAEQVSLQPISAYNIMLLDYAQALGVDIATYKEAQDVAISQQDFHQSEIYYKNARKTANAGITVGFSISSLICILFILLSPQLIQSFSNVSNESSSDSDSDMSNFLLITSLGLLADSIRNVSTGILIGGGKKWFPCIVSFIVMSLFCAPISGTCSLYFEFNPSWVFIIRDIGLGISGSIIFRELLKTFNKKEPALLQGGSARSELDNDEKDPIISILPSYHALNPDPVIQQSIESSKLPPKISPLSKSYSAFEANSNKAGRPGVPRSSSEIKGKYGSSSPRPLSPRSPSLQRKILGDSDESGLPRLKSELTRTSKKDKSSDKKDELSSQVPFSQNQYILSANSQIQQEQQKKEQPQKDSSWKCSIM